MLNRIVPNACETFELVADLDWRAGVGVDREHIQIRQLKAHCVVADAMEFVLPLSGLLVELDDEAGLRSFDSVGIGVRRGKPPGTLRPSAGKIARAALLPSLQTEPSLTMVV